jgi:hypothetical protein
MGTKGTGKSKGAAPKKTAGTKAASNERIQELVTKAIEGIESRLNAQDDPLGIGDYIKVMQLQKDIEDEQPREITVTWVDPESRDEK